MTGNVYAIPPQPPVAEHTRYFEAGNLSIGVEYRDLDPEGLVETYQDNPAYLAELLERSPAGGFSDEGLSLHVCGAEDGHEYLRFDVFDKEPHYHYNHPGAEVVNNVVDFDTSANGDMLPWALERIEHRLPEMLREAGGEHLVAGLDPASIGQALSQVRAVAARAVATRSGGSNR
ncbi:MAG TPA: hypothetical protein VHT49_09485 [Acidimicrobiales bacterium]|jgi:hypothetical protein|nr:hypothetical protein [Acidimicrobiales bacterium]